MLLVKFVQLNVGAGGTVLSICIVAADATVV
jgi:hypothetical protein